ncbi:MAG: hypothetical protein BWY63_00699 [Chloroflexi bacterium ADurb.Bin360]|nr:MAG: hypothetical protein BWY63_00699 [Chloroflexi bacterium ADurb.Bin360]
MGFLRNLFGKKQPEATPVAAELPTGAANPFTTEAAHQAGRLQFQCPTCSNTTSAALQQIDPIIGVNVACPSCKNICHVPGRTKTEPNAPDLKITGSVRVPIARYADWYYGHPYVKSLIRSSQSDLLFDYGLWAFCSACYHQFPATVLWGLASAQRAGGFVFNARTPDSAKDMQTLTAGHCSHCRNKELLVVVAEVPDYVREVILSKRK